MERIVFGLSKINFESNCEDVLTENRPPNFCSTTGDSTAASGTLSLISNCPTRSLSFTAMSHVNATTENKATTVDTATSPAGTTNTANPPADQLDSKPVFDFSVAPEEDDDEEKDGDCLTSTSRSRSKTIACFSQRRKMPARVSKENSLLKIKRRSIMKPTKKTTDVSLLRPSDIKQIYMTKSLGKFRSTNLETIFEEPQQEKRVASKNRSSSSMNESSDQLRFTGMKKLRRSLSCSDGLNVNKTLIKQRRAKIKKTFGKRFALKKIALDDFLEHLNKSIEERDEEAVPVVAELPVSDTAFFAEEASAMDE